MAEGVNFLCFIMPKKFKGENSKAVVAKERKSALREAAEQEKKKQEEDEYWRDDDKHVTRKHDRKVWHSVYIGTSAVCSCSVRFACA